MSTVKERAISPERRNLHKLFNLWVQHPETEHRYGALMKAMRDHELKERLRRTLSPSTP